MDQGPREFTVRQQRRPVLNRYEVRGPGGEFLALAQQKRLAVREQVTLYADEARQQVLATVRADRVLELGATYAVTGADGERLGSFRKQFRASLLRSTWTLESPGVGEAKGQERSAAVALARRGWDFVPWVGSVLPFPLLYHFDFTRDGAPVMSLDKQWNLLRDVYRVRVEDPALDLRLAIAVAVGMDALQGR